MEDEDTLTEIIEPTNAIEKPKRKVNEKQLAALNAGREKRKTKKNALDMAAPPAAPPAVPPAAPQQAPFVEPPIIVKKPKAKKRLPAKPTIIQFESESSESSDDDGPAPVIIIRNNKKKKAPIEQEPVVQQQPKQYIRRAY